jgi:hypothetical protein
MPKFTFIAEHSTGEKTTLEFEKDYLPYILENIEMFLRGTGFHFTGTLDFVEDAYEGQGFEQFDPKQEKELYHHV